MTKKEAKEVTGGLSKPSKMPGLGYSLPVEKCPVRRVYKDQKGSVCESCYAAKGRYLFSNVKDALMKRYESLEDPRWVDAMSTLIAGHDYFRWHDSGELQSIEHLLRIFEVANNTSDTKHWIPTRLQAVVVGAVERGIEVPHNVNVRISGLWIDEEMDLEQSLEDTHMFTKSEVWTDLQRDRLLSGWLCHATWDETGSHKCDNCRACWDKAVETVVYKKH